MNERDSVNDAFADKGRRTFKTLRGFLDGCEPDEEVRFSHSATLRIFGQISDIDQLTRDLELQPTHTHRLGDKDNPKSVGYKHDMWSYQPDTPKHASLEEHIDALWTTLKPHKAYLKELKRSLKVDVFLTYTSNCDHAGIEVPHTSLEMFTELEIPFGLSIITASRRSSPKALGLWHKLVHGARPSRETSGSAATFSTFSIAIHERARRRRSTVWRAS